MKASADLHDPFADVQQATRAHRREHGCEAYTFEDGPALSRLAADLKPRRVLELGTALGYTACCMAHASPDAVVDTIEGDPLHASLAREQIARHGLAARITVHGGQFETELARLAPGYDLAFFDGFAPAPAVIRRMRELLADGGVLVCSNLQLAHGAAARELAADLDDASRWRALPPVEGGRTRVLAKIPTTER